VKLNRKGFTLLELMVSMFIFTAALLTLLGISGTILSHNLQTDIRNEGMKVLENAMNQLKNQETPPGLVSRTVRGVPISYTINSQVTSIGNVNQLQATVSWQYKGVTYQHSMISVSD